MEIQMKKNNAAVLTALMALSVWTGSAMAAQSLPVSIKEGDKSFQGTLFYPDNAKGKLPLVMVVHEWWGKTEYPEMRARKIADELGYAALAVDLYGDGKTVGTPPEAQALATPFYKDPEIGVKRLKDFAAEAPAVAKQGHVLLDTSKIAAIGYCFGGTQVINLAIADNLPNKEKLLGIVSFHGGLDGLMKPTGKVKPKLLVLTGAADQMVPESKVDAFKDEMKKAKADFNVVAYPGAMHAFTNPKATELGKKYNIPIAYNEAADTDSWQKMKTFLKGLFGK
jgi:dienelactone hydrolase